MKVKVGDLLEDAGDGDIGLVVGLLDRWSEPEGFAAVPRVLAGAEPLKVALVLWAWSRRPTEMDTTAIDSGWVRIISRSA